MTGESLTTEQACKFLGCSPNTLRKHVKAGKIKVCNIGREHRYLVDDLKTLFDYANHGDNSNVIDFGKRKKEAKPCRKSINAGKTGISTIPMSTTNEYESLLGLK